MAVEKRIANVSKAFGLCTLIFMKIHIFQLLRRDQYKIQSTCVICGGL